MTDTEAPAPVATAAIPATPTPVAPAPVAIAASPAPALMSAEAQMQMMKQMVQTEVNRTLQEQAAARQPTAAGSINNVAREAVRQAIPKSSAEVYDPAKALSQSVNEKLGQANIQLSEEQRMSYSKMLASPEAAAELIVSRIKSDMTQAPPLANGVSNSDSSNAALNMALNGCKPASSLCPPKTMEFFAQSRDRALSKFHR